MSLVVVLVFTAAGADLALLLRLFIMLRSSWVLSYVLVSVQEL